MVRQARPLVRASCKAQADDPDAEPPGRDALARLAIPDQARTARPPPKGRAQVSQQRRYPPRMSKRNAAATPSAHPTRARYMWHMIALDDAAKLDPPIPDRNIRSGSAALGS